MCSEKILVIDDEPALVKLMERYLSFLGYAVESCMTGADACRVFRERPQDFALVLADMTMPDMPGEEIVKTMLGVRPTLPVLVCSGYPYDLSRLPAKTAGQIEFLQKPFVPKMLAEALDRILHAA